MTALWLPFGLLLVGLYWLAGKVAVSEVERRAEIDRRVVLDRAELYDLPFSPLVSDEDALAMLDEIRALPEVAA